MSLTTGDAAWVPWQSQWSFRLWMGSHKRDMGEVEMVPRLFVLLLLTGLARVAADDQIPLISAGQIQRSVEIAELRYNGAKLDQQQLWQRLAELMPEADRGISPAVGTDARRLSWMWEPMTRDAMEAQLRTLLAEPRAEEDLAAMAAGAGSRGERARFLALLAAARAQRGDRDGAWQAVRDAAGTLPPSWDLARFYRLCCNGDGAPGEDELFDSLARRPISVGSLISSDYTVPIRRPPEPVDGYRCPLSDDPELVRKIELSYRLPPSPSRTEAAAMSAWLQETERIIGEAEGSLERALMLIEAWRVVVDREVDDSPELYRQVAVVLSRQARTLESDLEGPRAATFAAYAAVVAGNSEEAAELLRISLRVRHLRPQLQQDTVKHLLRDRPDLVAELAREAVDAQPEVPCWLLADLARAESPEQVGPWDMRLALGQCVPIGELFNESVQEARERVVPYLESQGRPDQAFAIQALHEYRSWCGFGAVESAQRIVERTARLQIEAGLDQRGAAAAYLERIESQRQAAGEERARRRVLFVALIVGFVAIVTIAVTLMLRRR